MLIAGHANGGGGNNVHGGCKIMETDYVHIIIRDFMLEENARANPDARIRPLTHASVDRAYQAESVGSNSLVIILIAIRRSPNL